MPGNSVHKVSRYHRGLWLHVGSEGLQGFIWGNNKDPLVYFPCKFSFSSYVWFHFQNISLPCPNLCPGIHVLQIPALCHCFSKPCVSNSTGSLLWETPIHPSLIGKVTLLRVPLIIFGNTGPKAKYLLLSKLCLWPKTSCCLPQQWKHLQSNHWEVLLVPAGAWGPRVLAQRGAAQHTAPLAHGALCSTS